MPGRPRRPPLGAAIEAVARDLARQQAADGEGATTLITAAVTGAADDAEARAVARAVVCSSLVKAAAHGRDPNWGRIAGAAGNAALADAAVLEAAGLPADEATAPRPARAGRARPRRGCASRSRAISCSTAPPGGPVAFDRAAAREAMDAPELVIAPRPGPRRRLRRSLRLRPHRGLRHREQRVHDVSRGPRRQARWHDHRRPDARCSTEVAAVARRRPVVLVHGGGKRITEWLERLGVPSKFEGGLRVTDAAVARGRRRGPAGRRQQRARRRPARPRRRCRRAVRASTAACSSPSGSRSSGSWPASSACAATCSTRSSSAARCRSSRRSPATRTASSATSTPTTWRPGIAAGLGARQLVLLTDVDGVRDADGHKLDTLTVAEAEHLIETGVIAGGMVPKVRAALGALGWDGAEAIIADSSAPNALTRAP